jgi:hypothetical protein
VRRTLARAGLALLAFGGALLAQPSSVDAATVSKSAWWFRTSDPDSVLPTAARPPVATPDAPIDPIAPPDVPEGSVLVQGTPEGATAIAALTYALVEGESSPTLTIIPSETSSMPSDAVILACRAAVDWTVPETQPGRWQDKPLVDCGRSVNGVIAEDGTITFGLGPLVSGTELDVVLVPGTVGSTPAGAVGSAFSLSFDTAESATITSVMPSSSGSSSPPTSFRPASSPASGSLVAPPTGSFTAPSSPVVQPALEPQEQAPSVPDQPMLAAPAVAGDDDTAQGVAFLILLAGAALAGLAYLTPARDEEHVGLGRFRKPVPTAAVASPAEPVTGGLGRFARLRTAPPQHLS